VGVSHLVAKVVAGTCHNPWEVLSWQAQDGRWLLRVFVPGASTVSVVDDQGEQYALGQGASDSIFERLFDRQFAYRVSAQFPDGRTEVFRDPYAFRQPFCSDIDLHLFNEGRHLEADRRLGCHRRTIGDVEGRNFAV